MTPAVTAVLVGGPAIYLLGSLFFKHVVYQRIAYTHVAGLIALAALAAVASLTDRLMVGGLALVILIAVAATR